MGRSSFGKYQLIANLGSGGMADVYLAVAKGPAGFNKLVVVKCLRNRGMDDEGGDDVRLANREFVDMFLEEARLAARLNHPNIVQTNEVGEDAGDYFIAMEYLDGQSLNRVISRAWKRDGLPLGIALHCIAEALTALDHAHNLKDFDGKPLDIVHRDASPHNVFVTYEGQTKLVDFGIAKAATRGFETKTGIVKGKLPYMAPEQARCAEVDRRADVFSMGVMLWEILAKRRMWVGVPEIQVLQKLVSEPPPKLVDVAPETEPGLIAIVDKATAFAPEERYATADEMRTDLLAWVKAHDQGVTHKDVGRFVAELFADKRKLVQGIIEAQFAQIRAGQTVDLRTLDPMAATGSLPQSGSGQGSLSASQPRVDGDTSQPSTSSQVHASSGSGGLVSVPAVAANAQPSRTSMWIGLGGLAVAAVAIGVMIATRTSNAKPTGAEEPTTKVAQTAASTAAPTTAEPAATADGSSPSKPAADVVKITIHAAPDTAKIFVDGVGVEGNPYTGTFPRDGASHNVRVEADGYETKKALVSFDQDRLEEYALNRPGRPPVAMTPLPARTPDPTTTTTAAADPPPTTAPTPAGSGPKKPPTRDLNHDDPWKK